MKKDFLTKHIGKITYTHYYSYAIKQTMTRKKATRKIIISEGKIRLINDQKAIRK